MNNIDQSKGCLTPLYKLSGLTKTPLYICRCTCGAIRRVQVDNFRGRGPRACKGLARDSKPRLRGPAQDRSTSEYMTWVQMRSRCNNSKHRAYHRYGGRGIHVCERWDSYNNFLADMGPRPSDNHSIDRIDNDRGYSPDNCRWLERIDQGNNRSTCRYIDIDEEVRTCAQWSRAFNLPQWEMKNHLRYHAPKEAIEIMRSKL